MVEDCSHGDATGIDGLEAGRSLALSGQSVFVLLTPVFLFISCVLTTRLRSTVRGRTRARIWVRIRRRAIALLKWSVASHDVRTWRESARSYLMDRDRNVRVGDSWAEGRSLTQASS